MDSARSRLCAHPDVSDTCHQAEEGSVDEQSSDRDSSIVGDFVLSCVKQKGEKKEFSDNHWVDIPFQHRSFETQHELHDAAYCLNTGSQSHMTLARFWYEECQAKHPNCGRQTTSGMPSRLVHIRSSNLPKGLHILDAPTGLVPYACLSHRWGGVSNILKLKENNKQRLCTGFDLSELAKSFQDAIAIARYLGIDYIWVDTLCII